MIASMELNSKKVTIDLSKPIDISIALSPDGPCAWYADPMRIEPVRTEHFTGSVAEGGSVNFRNIFFNPHAHGTHTENVGHIATGDFDISRTLKKHFFSAKLISVEPETLQRDAGFSRAGDKIITREQIERSFGSSDAEALVVRTMPNVFSKLHENYSNTNFCYFEKEAVEWLVGRGVEHLLVDLPSIDREEDGGLLLAHHAFWQYPQNTREHCTITEFVYVNDLIPDGDYVLNLQVAAIKNDAAPSRPVLYRIV